MKDNGKNLYTLLGATVLFYVMLKTFRGLYLEWEHLFLTGLTSLLCAAAFGVVLWLIFSETEKLPRKKELAASGIGAVLFLALQWTVLTLVNRGGQHNVQAAAAAGTVLCLLFGAAVLMHLILSARRAQKLLKSLIAAVLGCLFLFTALEPHLGNPAFAPLDRFLQKTVYPLFNDYEFSVDTGDPGDTLPNVKSNLNRFGGRFPEDPVINSEYNPYEFVDYIQLMECSGGNAWRDLFKAPDDFSVLDDYDFSALFASCRGILKTGAKPLLKLGNVPSKLSRAQIREAGLNTGSFDVNVFPPDDYHEYYVYIRALAEALAEEFTADEVRTWRFGVLTEYENNDWFHTPDGDPARTLEAYCKLYDYTVEALTDVLGEDVFVGAHSMTCSEGLWDETEFIRHCGAGTNYATGKQGTRLNYLSASYYESTPGRTGNPKSIPEIMALLKGAAEDAGLTDLIYGVDEGRILVGPTAGSVSDELNSRTVGYTYQAAFDAHLIKQMFDSGMNYFSSWEYCSRPENHGLPLISYYTAKYAAAFEGSRLVSAEPVKDGSIPEADVNLSAAFNEKTNTLRMMVYNYKNTLRYYTAADVKIIVNAPQFADGKVRITLYPVDDNCNWFDEWAAEREALGFTDDTFSWSPDDGCPLWADADAGNRFYEREEIYAACARLTPETAEATVENGMLELNVTLPPHAVYFYEITQE